jgi:two-component system, sensor histidine kinase and response regulator
MTEASTSAAPEINVLLVDDVEQNLLATSALLARPGVRILTAGSGEQALECLLEADIAVALLDVQMPGMDGFELAELMRGADRTRHVPIIFLTAAGEERQRVFRGYDAGAVDFLHKPLDPQVLRSKVGVFVELAQQRLLLARRMDDLQRALQLNETLTAVLAHDLRTPLSAILTCAEIVLIADNPAAAHAAAQRIRASGTRMARMIDQLLDFSRLRGGVLELSPCATDLRQLCEQAIAEVAEAWPEARVELEVQSGASALLDADRMAQVLVNLLGNAAQHGQPGKPIALQAGLENGALRIRISNRGELPEAVRAGTFRPYQSGQRNGVGLGLYIVDQFVRAHRGSVHAASAAGCTTFELSLPQQAGQGAEAAAGRRVGS